MKARTVAPALERVVLQHPALLIGAQRQRWWLKAGALLEHAFSWGSPLGLRGERCVWAPVKGSYRVGWLASAARMSRPTSRLTLAKRGRRLALDRLRERMANTLPRGGYSIKRGDPLDPYSAREWLALFAPSLSRPTLLAALREAGYARKVAPRDNWELVRQLVLIACVDAGKEITVKSIRQQHLQLRLQRERIVAATAASKKKAKTSRAARKARTAGTGLVKVAALLREARAPEALVALAAPGAGRSALVKLRDGINAHVEKLREAKKGSLASRCSSANRVVRRLARAAK